MQRISIMGAPGSGKSTLARRLGEKLDLPVIHMDRVFWRPGWTAPTTTEQFHARLTEALAGEAWICEGDYSKHAHLRLPRSDTIIWPERSPAACLWRVIKRWLKYRGRTRPDMPDNCPEHINLEFWKYVWDYRRDKEPRTKACIAELGRHCEVVVLRSDAEVEGWLEGVRDNLMLASSVKGCCFVL